jgi:hypothetical protein
MGTAEASQAHLGKKQLTTLHAIGQSLALGPIFSAALFIARRVRARPRRPLAPLPRHHVEP